MPQSALVTLNSVKYRLKGPVQRFKVPSEAPVVRQEGLQRLESLTARSSFVFPSPIYGLGLDRIPSREINSLSRIGRIADSEDIDTRFKDTVLGILKEDSTEPTGFGGGASSILRATAIFRGDLWGLFDTNGDNSSNNDGLVVRKYTGSSTSWTGGGTVIANQSAPLVGFDLIATPSRLVAIFADEDVFRSRNSTDGATWNAPSTELPSGISLTNAVTAGEDMDGGKLVMVGTTLYAMLWDEDGGTMRIASSTDDGNVWGEVSGSPKVISDSGIKGAAAYFDLNGDPAPVATLGEGLYALDISANTIQLLMDFPFYSANNGRGLRKWSNPYNPHGDSLYFGTGDGGILEYTFVSSSSGVLIRNIGPDKDDGLPTAKQGHMVASVGSSQWLFYTYGGNAASKKASVMAWNGMGHLIELDGCGHHRMYFHGTANQELEVLALSARDDGTVRLHFSARTATRTSDTLFQAEPLASPASGVAVKREADGVMDRPRFDGGMPRDDATWIAVFREADDLSGSTSGEYINLDRGVDGATPTTDIGNVLSGAKEVQLGSGAGIAGRQFQLRENFNRAGTNTNTPKGGDVEVIYKKRIRKDTAETDGSKVLDGFRFTIDLPLTANNNNRTVEAIIKTLHTAEGNIPLQAFSYGKTGTRYVTVDLLGWLDHMGRQLSPYDDLPSHVESVAVEVREVL